MLITMASSEAYPSPDIRQAQHDGGMGLVYYELIVWAVEVYCSMTGVQGIHRLGVSRGGRELLLLLSPLLKSMWADGPHSNPRAA
jgi:hypothetical protein